jgi:hypothetical protein
MGRTVIRIQCCSILRSSRRSAQDASSSLRGRTMPISCIADVESSSVSSVEMKSATALKTLLIGITMFMHRSKETKIIWGKELMEVSGGLKTQM